MTLRGWECNVSAIHEADYGNLCVRLSLRAGCRTARLAILVQVHHDEWRAGGFGLEAIKRFSHPARRKASSVFHFVNTQIASKEAPLRRETLLASLRALPRAAWILFAGTFLNKFGAFVVPFLTLYLTSKGYSVSQVGLAVSAYGLGNLGASLLGGHLADKIGRRKTILLSMFSGAAAMMLLSQAQGFVVIILLTALTGLTGEFYRPASQALLADIVPAEQRVTAFAGLRVSFNAGFAFGPATAGLLAANGYFWLFAGDAATSVMFGLVALLALPQGSRSTNPNASWSDALRVLRRDSQLHQLLLANFAIGLVFFQLGSTYGLHVTRMGFSAAVYGAIFSLNGALIVFCELPLTRLTRKFPARPR